MTIPHDVTCLLSDSPVNVTANTFFGCRAADVFATPLFTISCPSNTVINVQSALVGYSGSYVAPTPSDPSGTCPWTDKTSNTCAALGITTACNPSPCQCNCTRSLPVPANCNGQSGSCSFTQNSLIFPNTAPLCQTSANAEFLVVNYTCSIPAREYEE